MTNAKLIINLILKQIGPDGTISALTPFYDYSTSKKIFDQKSGNCSKEVGSINKYLASNCKTRSIDPIFNISSKLKSLKIPDSLDITRYCFIVICYCD